MYVNPGKSKAIVFNYLVNNRQRLVEPQKPVKLDGLDTSKRYSLKEINLYPGSRSSIDSTTVYAGDFLMNVGVNPGTSQWKTSVVLEVNEVK
jgi:alpha-galactosidase